MFWSFWKSFSEINQQDYIKELKLLIEKLQPLGKGLKEYQKKQEIIKALLSKGYEYDLILGEFE